MSEIDVKQIVRNVLRDDGDPPSADYSPYDYGVEVARELNEESAPLLVAETIRVLPGTLAESFLNGVLDHYSIASLKDVLLNVLPHGREIGSAGTVERILIDRCHMPRLDLLAQLASEMERTTAAAAQNLCAFAIWLALGDPNMSAQMNPQKDEAERIEHILANVPTDSLTNYAREMLDRCRGMKRQRS